MTYYKFIKRIVDFICAILALPLIIPILLVLSFVIYLEDKGPIFYNGYRLGKNGKKFKMYKLRSMRINSPDLRNPDGSTYNSENDPRITSIGRFIRKTSIDELPQVINILRGEMSIVGPRPILFITPEEFNKFDSKLIKRMTVRPGITGYTQAYFRNSIDQEQKFEYDVFYVDNMNFFLDVKIILKTIYSVLKKENIYSSKI